MGYTDPKSEATWFLLVKSGPTSKAKYFLWSWLPFPPHIPSYIWSCCFCSDHNAHLNMGTRLLSFKLQPQSTWTFSGRDSQKQWFLWKAGKNSHHLIRGPVWAQWRAGGQGTGRRNKGDSLGESQSSFSNFRGTEERNSDQSTISKMQNLGSYLLSNPCHKFS